MDAVDRAIRRLLAVEGVDGRPSSRLRSADSG